MHGLALYMHVHVCVHVHIYVLCMARLVPRCPTHEGKGRLVTIETFLGPITSLCVCTDYVIIGAST